MQELNYFSWVKWKSKKHNNIHIHHERIGDYEEDYHNLIHGTARSESRPLAKRMLR